MAGQESSFYNDNVSGTRFLILSDMEQTMPATRCKVTDAKKRTSNTGKEFPVLTITDADGNDYDVSAWQRDVKDCITQWGNKNPKDWGFVGFRKIGNRYTIVPHADQSVEVENVQ